MQIVALHSAEQGNLGNSEPNPLLLTAEGEPSAALVALMEEFVCNTGDLGLTPESGRSPGEGNHNHSNILAWKSVMDRGAW